MEPLPEDLPSNETLNFVQKLLISTSHAYEKDEIINQSIPILELSESIDSSTPISPSILQDLLKSPKNRFQTSLYEPGDLNRLKEQILAHNSYPYPNEASYIKGESSVYTIVIVLLYVMALIYVVYKFASNRLSTPNLEMMDFEPTNDSVHPGNEETVVISNLNGSHAVKYFKHPRRNHRNQFVSFGTFKKRCERVRLHGFKPLDTTANCSSDGSTEIDYPRLDELVDSDSESLLGTVECECPDHKITVV